MPLSEGAASQSNVSATTDSVALLPPSNEPGSVRMCKFTLKVVNGFGSDF